MLLVIDIGNTNTVLGVYAPAPENDSLQQGQPGHLPGTPEAAPCARKSEGDVCREPQSRYSDLVANWRVTSNKNNTVDEYGVLFRNLFAMANLEVASIDGIVASSVVPPMNSTLREVCERYFHIEPLFIEPGVKTGMPVNYENPSEVGADRIVNSVAAFEKYGGPCIVVDFGTATTFDAVSRKGEYMGGMIAPGVGISADALFSRTARLPRVDIRKPARVIGSNTIGSMQAGLFYGYLGLTDGILERMVPELGADTKVIATGGLAELIGHESRFIKAVDNLLTLDGLRIIWERNAAQRRAAKK
jgi:type III pantothenate kinase